MCVQISVSGRFLSIFDPHESSKVSFSLKRGAQLHIFTRSPFFGRLRQKSRQHESNMYSRINQQSSKTQFWTHRFLGSCLASIFDQKWLQKAIPKSCPRRPLSCPRRPFDNFFGVIFRIRFFGAPRLHFGVIWASF